ncbi:MAG: hypothetical protein HYV08_01200, partial [Deltaproteobacteria bacterium]|nr:hypothetical protein [Deltaproteobacteria bacterium]
MMASARWGIFPDNAQPPKEIQALAAQVEADGGQPLAAYRDPVGHAWQIFAILPLKKVQPTPYQRDLSRSHAIRLRDEPQELLARINAAEPAVAIAHARLAQMEAGGRA